MTVRLFLNLHPQDLLDREPGTDHTPLVGIADKVVLEITERQAVGHQPEVERNLDRLRKLGFTVAVDDLGAGYAGPAFPSTNWV